MSIDADLCAGHIDHNEARRWRANRSGSNEELSHVDRA